MSVGHAGTNGTGPCSIGNRWLMMRKPKAEDVILYGLVIITILLATIVYVVRF